MISEELERGFYLPPELWRRQCGRVQCCSSESRLSESRLGHIRAGFQAHHRRSRLHSMPTAAIVADIISLLNKHLNALISKGEPLLGFLDSWMYGNGFGGINDFTSRACSNPGRGTDGFSVQDRIASLVSTRSTFPDNAVLETRKIMPKLRCQYLKAQTYYLKQAISL
ncbi:hypothetical protein EI94DRAFT_592728 [Lactarius quietus]|nr:hypothetical protein EI94DRAFT_592728 [Lactarius quietus]